MKKAIIDKLDVSRHLADHLIGSNHTHVHRSIFGILVGYFGTWLAHAAAHYHTLIALTGDLIGFGIHAIGLIPIIHLIEHRHEQTNSNDSGSLSKLSDDSDSN